jgi:hypothetical protein
LAVVSAGWWWFGIDSGSLQTPVILAMVAGGLDDSWLMREVVG